MQRSARLRHIRYPWSPISSPLLWISYHVQLDEIPSLPTRRANVILINTFYELEKPLIDAVRNEVLGTSYGKVSVA
jgi:hypothetical protein